MSSPSKLKKKCICVKKQKKFKTNMITSHHLESNIQIVSFYIEINNCK